MNVSQSDNMCRMIFLPGLGADHRLLDPQRRDFPQLVVPPWLAPENQDESLAHYAERFAETLEPVDHPLVLGGVSFGGMLAYEMAHHLRPEAVVQIASCRTRRAVPWRYRVLQPAVPWLPGRLFDVGNLLGPAVLKLCSHVAAVDRRILLTMFRESDRGFMKWTVRAILGWHPTPPAGVRVFQIHGRRDAVLPCRVARVTTDENTVDESNTADEIIADGGHLINVTHADRVNRFIARAVRFAIQGDSPKCG